MAHLMSGNTQAGVAQFRELARDEFAAIPRDMFWFTAIALLGETCALIGDTRAGARSSTGCSSRTARSSCRSPGREPRLHAPLPRAAGDRAGRPRRAPRRTSSAALERNTACGLRPVVALMRREYAEMLMARGETDRARELLQETLREAEAGGMSQLISRVRMRLDELAKVEPRPT